MKRFLEWLALTNSKGYPIALEDFTVYLQARQSEPCTRGALNRAYEALVLLEEAASVTNEAKVTTTSVHLSIEKEFLATSRPTKQAPRRLICTLTALQQLAVDGKALPYFRIYAWWCILQSWGTMRFSDHRDLKSADVTVTRNSMVAHLTR